MTTKDHTEEFTIVRGLVKRAIEATEQTELDNPEAIFGITMTVLDCHRTVCPLDLDRMVEWERDYDIVHDIGGITKYWNGETLTDCFLPRFAA